MDSLKQQNIKALLSCLSLRSRLPPETSMLPPTSIMWGPTEPKTAGSLENELC